MLIGGASRNPAVQQIAAEIFGKDVYVPPFEEYVAKGAAKQAAWALLGGKKLPTWESKGFAKIESSSSNPEVRERYFHAIESL